MRNNVKNKPMTTEQLRHFSYQTCQWWKAVIVQAKRFFDVCEKCESSWPWDETEEDCSLIADRLFLIIAVYHAIENLQKLDIEMQRKNDDSFQVVLQAVEKVAPFKDIQNLRDMNEHSLDYLINLGNRQEEYCNAAWTIINGNTKEFMLGNVHIDKLLLSMKEQYPIVRDKTKEIFDNPFLGNN